MSEQYDDERQHEHQHDDDDAELPDLAERDGETDDVDVDAVPSDGGMSAPPTSPPT